MRAEPEADCAYNFVVISAGDEEGAVIDRINEHAIAVIDAFCLLAIFDNVSVITKLVNLNSIGATRLNGLKPIILCVHFINTINIIWLTVWLSRLKNRIDSVDRFQIRATVGWPLSSGC